MVREITATIQIEIKQVALAANEYAFVFEADGRTVKYVARPGTTIGVPPTTKVLVGTKPELQGEVDAARAVPSAELIARNAKVRRDLWGQKTGAVAAPVGERP